MPQAPDPVGLSLPHHRGLEASPTQCPRGRPTRCQPGGTEARFPTPTTTQQRRKPANLNITRPPIQASGPDHQTHQHKHLLTGSTLHRYAVLLACTRRVGTDDTRALARHVRDPSSRFAPYSDRTMRSSRQSTAADGAVLGKLVFASNVFLDGSTEDEDGVFDWAPPSWPVRPEDAAGRVLCLGALQGSLSPPGCVAPRPGIWRRFSGGGRGLRCRG